MAKEHKIAIVGMGGVLPGAGDLAGLWQNILNGTDSCRPVPKGRWLLDPKAIFHGGELKKDHIVGTRGYFVTDFDLELTGLDIDQALVDELDPSCHFALKAGREAFFDCRTSCLDRSRVGVIIGNIALPTQKSSALARDYLGSAFEESLLGRVAHSETTHPLNHYSAELPAAVLARALGLGGKSYTLDAACASSLYAIKLAVDELRSFHLDAVITGGMSRPDTLYTQMGFSQLGALSKTGICRPFDHCADGLLVGEGAGMIVLKRLEDALEDGDHIYGIIAGIGLSSDVQGSLMAPMGEGQVRALEMAYRQAGCSPTTVDLIECHATGTPLGDRVELESLISFFKPYEKERCGAKIAIGSLKANIGHLLTGAGAVGVLKALLALKNEVLPPMPNYRRSSDNIIERSIFQVRATPCPWPRRADGPRRCGVSGFGFGGINAHLVIEEWPKEAGYSKIPSEIPTPQKGEPKISPSHPEQPSSVKVELKAAKEAKTAIVGMTILTPDAEYLGRMQEGPGRCLEGVKGSEQLNFWGAEKTRWFQGWFGPDKLKVDPVCRLKVPFWRFRIPPSEYKTMLPQQIIMLLAADSALFDAGYDKAIRLDGGAFIGICQDPMAGHFNCRWDIKNRVEGWARELGYGLDPDEIAAWEGQLRDTLGPALSADGTIGSLGSIVASRIAKEFKFGGMGFTLSCGENSGIRALEVAHGAISRGELGVALVGGIDLCAQFNSALAHEAFLGSLELPRGVPKSDTAVALVLKKLELAQRDQNHIYGVIESIGSSVCGGGLDKKPRESDIHHGFQLAKEQAFQRLKGSEKAAQPYESVCTKESGIYRGAASGLHAICRGILGRAADKGQGYRIGVNTSGYDGAHTHTIIRVGIDTNLGASKPKGGALNPPTSYTPLTITVGGSGFGRIPLPPSRPKEVESKNPSDISLLKPPCSGSQEAMAFEGGGGQGGASSVKGASLRVKESISRFMEPILKGVKTTIAADISAHSAHLALGDTAIKSMGKLLSWQLAMVGGGTLSTDPSSMKTKGSFRLGDAGCLKDPKATGIAEPASTGARTKLTASPLEQARTFAPLRERVALDYNMCLEFARGSIAKVLGAKYAPIDQHPTRVRLPDGPLLLCHRIMRIDAEPLSMKPGRIITEHDIVPEAYYLDNDQIPSGIAIEAGQADLFLSAYLGVDFRTKGKAMYRLLDATVTFHSDLPKVGETINYDIKIIEFFYQGETILFRFEFDATLAGVPLLTMKNGVAGFFTQKELEEGRGIVKTTLSQQKWAGKYNDFSFLVPMECESYDEDNLEALRKGDYQGCFGALFANLGIKDPGPIPSGKMALIDRIITISPSGGKYQLGRIVAEVDIHPDDWFLTCHFMDDPVMPGTLMYEGCFQTLRVFLMRLGWVGEKEDMRYAPIYAKPSQLRCRGQVLPHTKKVRYELLLKEIGYGARGAYAISDANMYADGKHIVEIYNIHLCFPKLDKAKLAQMWQGPKRVPQIAPLGARSKGGGYDRRGLNQFATGQATSAIFGERYRAFDDPKNFIARLPAEPFLFIDRVLAIAGTPFTMAEGSEVVTSYTIDPKEWYFEAEGTGYVPYSIVAEIALQTCGFLAAYMGSALQSREPLYFRNLQAKATLYGLVTNQPKALTVKSKVIDISKSKDIIIQSYDFSILCDTRVLYQGSTAFGFFSRKALTSSGGGVATPLIPNNIQNSAHPQKISLDGGILPQAPILMLDEIVAWEPHGGSKGLGYIVGLKYVDPEDWFFKVHFFQDPVMPGSLGLESAIQLLKFVAKRKWNSERSHIDAINFHPQHEWFYRGQVLPTNRRVKIEVDIIAAPEGAKELVGNAQLYCDDSLIYTMKNFSIRVKG